jgi:hypothetical protein
VDSFGETLIGRYLPSGTASAPEDEPSTNSIGGGSKLLNASTSRAGRNESESSADFAEFFGEKDAGGRSGDASIMAGAGSRGRARTRRTRGGKAAGGGGRRAAGLGVGELYVAFVENLIIASFPITNPIHKSHNG